MRLKALGASVIVLFSGVLGCGGRDKPPSDQGVSADKEPAWILDQALEAHGGAAKLATHRAGRVSGSSKGPEIDLTFEEIFILPGRLRKTSRGSFGGQVKNNLYVQNNDRAWSQDPPRASVPVTPSWDTGGVLGPILLLDQLRDEKLERTAKKTLAGSLVRGFKVREMAVYFDDKTGLTAGYELTLTVGGKAVKAAFLYSDYHDVDGVQLPRRSQVRSDDRVMWANQITEFNFKDKVSEALFERP